MFDTIGDRITYCRSLLNLARNEMARQIGGRISLPTLTRWELNTVTPSTKKIIMLSEYFISKRINVSHEWLKLGKGFPPVSLELSKFDVNQFDELAYNTLVGVRNKVKNFFFQQINSNFYRPIVSFGDYIGGIEEENHKLLENKLSFVCSSEVVTIGIYNSDKNIIINLSGEAYELSDKELKMGEVQWILRRP